MKSLLLFALLMHSASAGSWADVETLAPGTKVRIELGAGRIDGLFGSASKDAVVIRVGRRETRFNRASVRAVAVARGDSRRSRNIGIGLFAGMGAGAVIYGNTCRTNCSAEGAPVWTAPLSLVGLIAGAVAPAESWQPVYRR